MTVKLRQTIEPLGYEVHHKTIDLPRTFGFSRAHGLLTITRSKTIEVQQPIQIHHIGSDFFGFVPRTLLLLRASWRNESRGQKKRFPNRLLLANTHVTHGASHKARRKRQTQLLNLLAVLEKTRSRTESIIMGSDLNISPSFTDGPFLTRVDKAAWQANSLQYEWFARIAFSTLKLIDTYKHARPKDNGFTQDRERNPLTRYGFATRVEPSQRIDFIWFANAQCSTKQHQLNIDHSEICFDRPFPDPQNPSKALFLSDHFGVLAQFSLPPFTD